VFVSGGNVGCNATVIDVDIVGGVCGCVVGSGCGDVSDVGVVSGVDE